MNKWFVENELHRIYLEEGTPDEQWVDVKAKLSVGDQDALGQLLFEVKIDTQKMSGLSRAERRRQAREGNNLDASFKPSTVALLQVSIVDWSFLDENNNKIPVNREWISRLKPEWAMRIEEELDYLNPLVEPTTQENTETPLKADPQSSQPQLSDI